MGWFRVSCNVGSAVVVRAESREQAIRALWNTLEEFNRAAVEGLRVGRYLVSEEHTPNLAEAARGVIELRALLYAPRSRAPSGPRGSHAGSQDPPERS